MILCFYKIITNNLAVILGLFSIFDRVAFLRELIMILDSSLTLSGLLSSDDLNDIISHACTS